MLSIALTILPKELAHTDRLKLLFHNLQFCNIKVTCLLFPEIFQSQRCSSHGFFSCVATIYIKFSALEIDTYLAPGRNKFQLGTSRYVVRPLIVLLFLPQAVYIVIDIIFFILLLSLSIIFNVKY